MPTTATETLVSPPIVHISPEVLYSAEGDKAYSDALDSANGVVVVPRGGRMEHIIDHKHAYEVLTDGKSFLFDKGVVKMMHMEFMMWFKNATFVTELDGLVQTTVQSRLGAVVGKLEPLLQQSFGEQFETKSAEKEWVAVDNVFDRVQNVIALAMVVLICGGEHISQGMINNFVATTNATAKLSGFFEHVDGWPLWLRWLYPYWSTTAALFVIAPRLLFGILPELWRTRHSHYCNAKLTKPGAFTPLFDHLLAHHWSPEQSLFVSFGNFLWCSILAVGIIFASIHQTVVVTVWVMVELTRRQDIYLERIQQEWRANVSHDENGNLKFGIQDLNKLNVLDSFIREVMRTKGDAFAPVRFTTRAVRVGGYTLPPDAICLPYVRRAHSHPDNYGADGDVFDGFRWVGSGRPAVQGNESFLSFGVGRWACPGRHLAVAEIKILACLLFSQFDVKLDESTFEVLDCMNTTSVPPKATLYLRRRLSPS